MVELKRLDESDENIEVSFIVEAQNFDELNKAKNEIQKLNNNVQFTFLDNKGLV